MARRSLLVLLPILAACAPPLAPALGPPCNTQPGRVEGRYCAVEHDSRAGEDARRVDVAATEAIDALNAEFADVEAHLLAPGSLACEIHVFSKPVPGVDGARANAERREHDRRLPGGPLLLGPSVMPTTAKTMLGEPKDDVYLRKVLGHELSTIALERITRRKKAGWYFHAAPPWFEEYLGRTLARDPSRAGISRYVAAARADPSQLFDGDVLRVRNPYLGGTVLVAFLYDVYGRGAVRRLLTSVQPTFDAAWREAIGLGDVDLVNRVRAWLAQNK